MRKQVKAKDTLAVSTKIVLPNDTNTLDNLFGGSLLSWMDEISAISAQRHCKRVVVTASVNNVSFDKPIHLGDTVTIEAKVSRAFKSSMEVYVDVYVEDQRTGLRTKCNEAMFMFVAVDQMGSPIEIPEVAPETDEELLRYEGAMRRRELSLVLAGKLKPNEADELKRVFED